MARTTIDETFNPVLLSDTIASKIAQKNALHMSALTATGAAIVRPNFTGGRGQLGHFIDVPYFGGVGTFERNVSDGAAATPRAPEMTSEQAEVIRDTLSFEMTAWAQSSASADPYEDAANSVIAQLSRVMDNNIVDAASAAGMLTSTTSGALDYDKVIDGQSKFRDDGRNDIVAMIIHSEAERDLRKESDSTGRPLLVTSQNDDDFLRFAGVPVVVSNRVPVTGSTMGTVTEAGTSPPDLTLAGTPEDAWDLVVECVVGGSSDGTATFRFSTDGGDTFGATHIIPSGGGAFVLDESPQAATAANAQPDSLVGNNGSTGITATFTNGTYNADNVYTAQADMTLTSLLVQRGAIAFWFNAALLQMLTDTDILRHTDIAAMHLYSASLRYRRRVGGTRTGVVGIVHGSSRYDGTLEA